GVLGSGCVLLHDSPGSGLVLWVVELVLWVGLSYTILPGLIEAEDKPELEKGLSGVWLLTVVATQSVCVLGGLVVPHLPGAAAGGGRGAGGGCSAALGFGLVGGLLSRGLPPLFFSGSPSRPPPRAALPPPYWINMGAVAISALGGVSLVSAARGSELLAEL